MVSRREFIRSVALAPSLLGFAITGASCAADDRYGAAVRALRSPLNESTDHAALLLELVRCSTLAANSHNTQPWKFGLSPHRISIRPDLSPPVNSTLVNAIFQRQCSRAEYNGQPIPNNVLQDLTRAADRSGVRLLLLTERAKVEGLLDYVTQGNSAQIRNAAFVNELKTWVRFNEADALATGDGLFSRLSDNPTLPRWLGNAVFSMVLSEKSENDKYAKHLRSSAGVAVFVGERADRASWFEVGRAYQHFALAATALGVRTAFVNQPVEVPAVRTQFAQWLGLAAGRPDLVVRFGRGPQLPYSLRVR
jgi:nitroreductase